MRIVHARSTGGERFRQRFCRAFLRVEIEQLLLDGDLIALDPLRKQRVVCA